MEEVAPGLRRWTVPHEEWTEDVAAVAVDTADGLVLIDPIEPPRELRRPDHVLYTIFWHARTARGLVTPRVWSAGRTVKAMANRGVDVTDSVRDGVELPGGIRAFATARHGELAYWLPEQRAVVVGDVLLGAGAKPQPTGDALRLCPERWLGKKTHHDLRESLRPLLDLPVARVLPSHGRPVLRSGGRALEQALS